MRIFASLFVFIILTIFTSVIDHLSRKMEQHDEKLASEDSNVTKW